MAHWFTNRGKLRIVQGDWDDAAAGDFLMGLCTTTSPGTVPTGADTEAEIQDLNFVSELDAISGVDRATWGGYADLAMSRVAAAEDDTNNRVNLDAADVVFTGAAVVSTLTHCWGGFIYKTGASDAARDLVSVFTFATAIPLNGSSITVAIADVARVQ